MPAFRRQNRQISKFEAHLVYSISPRTGRATQRNSVSIKKKKRKKPKTLMGRHGGLHLMPVLRGKQGDRELQASLHLMPVLRRGKQGGRELQASITTQ